MARTDTLVMLTCRGSKRRAPTLRVRARRLETVPRWRNWQTQWSRKPPAVFRLAGSSPALGTTLICSVTESATEHQ